jgi:hypothetical protein
MDLTPSKSTVYPQVWPKSRRRPLDARVRRLNAQEDAAMWPADPVAGPHRANALQGVLRLYGPNLARQASELPGLGRATPPPKSMERE